MFYMVFEVQYHVVTDYLFGMTILTRQICIVHPLFIYFLFCFLEKSIPEMIPILE